MLKEPVDVVYSGLEGAIGHPKDIAANLKANGNVNFNMETPIPRPAGTSSTKKDSSAMIVDQMAGEPVAPVTAFEEAVSQKSDCHTK